MRNTTWLGLLGLLMSTTASAAPVATDDDDEPADHADEASTDDAPVVEVGRGPVRPRRALKRELYFRAGIAHVEPRTASGGMTIEPAGITRLVPMPPVQGGIETSPSNVFTGSSASHRRRFAATSRSRR